MRSRCDRCENVLVVEVGLELLDLGADVGEGNGTVERLARLGETVHGGLVAEGEAMDVKGAVRRR